MARLALAAIAAATVVLAGCGSSSAPPADRVQVPDLHGMQSRPAQELLARRGLRWRWKGTTHVEDAPPPAGMASTADDDLVVEQAPKAGTLVERGSVVTLKTSCTLEPLPPGQVCID